MKEILEHVRLRSDDEPIAPVTILDARGRVVRVLAAEEFRTTHPLDGAPRAPATALGRGRRSVRRMARD